MKTSKQCKKFRSVQTRVFCFHESHQDGPRELHECTSKSRHLSTIFCLMHRSKTEPLPNPLCLSSVAQEYSRNNITKRTFSIDKDFRKKLHSKGREAFSRSGYHTLHIVFTTDEEQRLTASRKGATSAHGLRGPAPAVLLMSQRALGVGVGDNLRALGVGVGDNLSSIHAGFSMPARPS